MQKGEEDLPSLVCKNGIEEDMACMAENDIDIILPYSTIHYPSIDEHHRRYVKEDEFCGWLFPVLKRTEELSRPKGWERADRYMGYLGENLTTLYFMYHKNDLRTAHAGRLMLV